jgi:hypothetical protein
MQGVGRHGEPAPVGERFEDHIGQHQGRLAVEHVGQARGSQLEFAEDEAVRGEGLEVDLHVILVG